MSQIAVLMLPEEKHIGRNYLVLAMADLWRKNGHEVVVVYGTRRRAAADLVVLHVNATFVPAPYLKYSGQYPRTINGTVSDISKRFISRQAVLRDDSYCGPVLVKTNLNYRGAPELNANPLIRAWLKVQTLIKAKPSWKGFYLSEYHVFESKHDVPVAVWNNRHLFVEKFLPERDGEFYCLRTWVFFGKRETASLSHSLHPVIKGTNVVKRQTLETIPDELREIRRQLGFDFGKFDFVMIDGRPVLYDVNRTPTIGNVPPEVIGPMVENLAQGIEDYAALE